MENEHVAKNVLEKKSVTAASSVPGASPKMGNPDAENLSRELTELITKAKVAREQTGTITQIISGGFLGISILFVITMAQMKISFSLDTSLCFSHFVYLYLLFNFSLIPLK